MDDLHEMNLCNTVHKMAFSSIYNKKRHLGFYSTNKVGTLWSVTYYIFTVIDSYRQKKKKKKNGSGREWESFFREWNGIFLQFFRGIGTGRD